MLHPKINQNLPAGSKTVAEYLKEHGYATACIGKWHLGAKGHLPTDHGFDTYYAGNQVFQQPGADVFQALMGLRDELRNPALDSSAKAVVLSQRLAQIQSARDAVIGTTGEQSTSLESMQALSSRIADLKLSTQTRVTDLEGTDISAAVIRLHEQENLFQATLGVTSRMFGPTFLDFIK